MNFIQFKVALSFKHYHVYIKGFTLRPQFKLFKEKKSRRREGKGRGRKKKKREVKRVENKSISSYIESIAHINIKQPHNLTF